MAALPALLMQQLLTTTAIAPSVRLAEIFAAGEPNTHGLKVLPQPPHPPTQDLGSPKAFFSSARTAAF